MRINLKNPLIWYVHAPQMSDVRMTIWTDIEKMAMINSNTDETPKKKKKKKLPTMTTYYNSEINWSHNVLSKISDWRGARCNKSRFQHSMMGDIWQRTSKLALGQSDICWRRINLRLFFSVSPLYYRLLAWKVNAAPLVARSEREKGIVVPSR